MKKRGFTIIELLIVIALIGTLIGIGSFSIKKQAESRGMLRVRNEVGDFFRVAAKRSQETGKKYIINFDLAGKKIEITRNGEVTDSLELPNVFEYGIKWGTGFQQTFSSEMESHGFLDKNFTLYITKSNSQSGIQGEEEVKYAVSFNLDDHIKYLHVREYIPTETLKASEINSSPSGNLKFKLIKN